MEYAFDYAMEGGIGFVILWVLYMLSALGFGGVLYVLRSLGLHTIAKNRGIRHPWFAWLPVVDQYLLGCISDQYQYVVKGREKNRRKIMLALNILLGILYAAFIVMYILMIVGAIQGTVGAMNGNVLVSRLLSRAVSMMLMGLPMAGLGIAAMVFRCIAMYDLYTSCSPSNNVLFLVLGILFPVTEPFFIFFNRKKEDGMPPRKRPAAQEPVFQHRAEEPWNNME